jgi:hypothetical protein
VRQRVRRLLVLLLVPAFLLPAPARAATVTKVLTIVLENHGTTSASAGMPYLVSLGQRYGRTTGYRSLTHPSLPNYLVMAGGSTFGVRDDGSPSQHRLPGRSVFDVALSRGRTAKTYAESMGSTHCRQSSGGSYAARHNPWVYFAQGRTACSRYDVDLGTPKAGALRNDVVYGRLPSVGLVVPNLCHDAHDCSLRTADTWLRQWVPLLQSGPDWRTGRLAVVITFDEVEGSGTGTLLTVVLAPQLSHKVVATRLDHYSWCRWMTDAVGAAPLRSAAGATSLGRAFGL